MTQHLSGSLVAPWEEGPDENHYPLPGVLPLGKSPSSRAELRTRRPSFYVGAGGGGPGSHKCKPRTLVGGRAWQFPACFAQGATGGLRASARDPGLGQGDQGREEPVGSPHSPPSFFF